MSSRENRKPVGDWGGKTIAPGESSNVFLTVSQSYSGMNVKIPIHVRRGLEDGPVVFVTAALHGDEINGTGAVRQLIQDSEFQLVKGAIVLIPVLNILAFNLHSRYLPDRRDLNRSFPGSRKGSLAARMARIIFDEIVSRCDYGIDLHTAALRRTNYPNIRGDLENPEVERIAKAFGCEIIMNGKGPIRCFRREACEAGCHTIVMEGGEVNKVEPVIVKSAVRGVKNVLRELGMLADAQECADYQVIVRKSKWLRAEKGGFLRFHIQPGEIVEAGQPLTTNSTLLGSEHQTLCAPFDSVVIGMTTLPATSPGDPICNLGHLPDDIKPSALRRLRRHEDGLEARMVKELSSNLLVVQPSEDTTDEN